MKCLIGEPLPRKTLDPISDVLTLEFGLSHLVLDNCSLEDDVCVFRSMLLDTVDMHAWQMTLCYTRSMLTFQIFVFRYALDRR